MHVSIFQGIELVFCKEFVTGLRFKAAWAAMFMFALTTLACVSMALQGGGLDPRLQAALLWVILFFASMAGADRVFADEDMAGTLLALQVYGPSQAVLLGKMIYTFFLQAVLAMFIVPLFLMFMDCMVLLPLLFMGGRESSIIPERQTGILSKKLKKPFLFQLSETVIFLPEKML